MPKITATWTENGIQKSVVVEVCAETKIIFQKKETPQ